jgi:hypothetical protein
MPRLGLPGPWLKDWKGSKDLERGPNARLIKRAQDTFKNVPYNIQGVRLRNNYTGSYDDLEAITEYTRQKRDEFKAVSDRLDCPLVPFPLRAMEELLEYLEGKKEKSTFTKTDVRSYTRRNGVSVRAHTRTYEDRVVRK